MAHPSESHMDGGRTPVCMLRPLACTNECGAAFSCFLQGAIEGLGAIKASKSAGFLITASMPETGHGRRRPCNFGRLAEMLLEDFRVEASISWYFGRLDG